jgi:hypothetical protein
MVSLFTHITCRRTVFRLVLATKSNSWEEHLLLAQDFTANGLDFHATWLVVIALILLTAKPTSPYGS